MFRKMSCGCERVVADGVTQDIRLFSSEQALQQDETRNTRPYPLTTIARDEEQSQTREDLHALCGAWGMEMMDKGVWLARYTAHDGDTNDKCAVKRG